MYNMSLMVELYTYYSKNKQYVERSIKWKKGLLNKFKWKSHVAGPEITSLLLKEQR